MKYVLSAAEMKLYDKRTSENLHIEPLVLMEKAALSVYDEIVKYLKNNDSLSNRIIIFVGSGNNGADGLALARILTDNGYLADVVYCGNKAKASKENVYQLDILENYSVNIYYNYDEIVEKLNIGYYSVVIDSLFGIGLNRNIEGEYLKIIDCINMINIYTIAIDIPSGINTDLGCICGKAVKADLTVTFGFYKFGHLINEGREYCGKVIVKEIGINSNSFMGDIPGCFTYEDEMVNHYPERKASGNKGSFGKVLVCAGSKNMAGAAILCVRAAMAAGAGMVKLISDASNRIIIQETVPEALYSDKIDFDKDFAWGDCLVIGPGLGDSDDILLIIDKAVESFKGNIIIDADGLNAISKNKSIFDKIKNRNDKIIFTPHLGELARLCDIDIKDIKNDILKISQEFAIKTNIYLVAKDSRTFVCDGNGKSYLNISGNDGMATAGSGDVLSGIIAGFLAQYTKNNILNKSTFEIVCDAVYVHGCAGDKACKISSNYSLTAGDIISKGMI